ncbi:hypothetical protein [Flavobacterium sp.]
MIRRNPCGLSFELKPVIEGYLRAGTSNSSASKDKNGSIGSNDFWLVN